MIYGSRKRHTKSFPFIKTCALFSVALDCKKAGLKVDVEEISKSVMNVSKFFLNAKCVEGKRADGKSSSEFVNPGKKRTLTRGVFSQFWRAVDKFEKEQLNEKSSIVSCSEINVSNCVKCLDQAFLIISSNDWNSKDFKSQLGKVLLQPKATLCVVLEGLRKEGSNRLLSFLTSVSALFDSRVRIVIFGEEGLYSEVEEFSQKHFVMEEIGESSKRMKQELTSSDNLKNPLQMELEKRELLLKESDEVKSENLLLKEDQAEKIDELLNLSLEIKRLDEQCSTLKVKLSEERDQLKSFRAKIEDTETKNEDLARENSVLKEKVETGDEEIRKLLSHSKKVTDDLYELKREYKNTSERDLSVIEELKSQNRTEKEAQDKRIRELVCGKEAQEKSITELKSTITELKKRLVTNKNLEVLESVQTQTQGSVLESSLSLTREPVTVETQTESVISKPPLSVLCDELFKHESSSSAVHQVYKSIKNLKSKESYTKNDSVVTCQVEIVKGNHIMKFPDLTHFTGEGETEKQAKNAAFANFVSSVFKLNE